MTRARCAAIKLGEDDVQVEGPAVMLETFKEGEGTGKRKQGNALMATEIVHDVITLVDDQSVDANIMIPGIVTDEDNVDEFMARS